ncbi:S24 family peptidase [Chitiniphilus shinanonensis]|uniref:S24 family peptidase n=1 Tax=Chitiniphilus shinanonensis TaxID=553088 RepID=UPI0033415D47
MSRLAERVSVLSGRKVSPQTIRYLVKGDARQGNKSPSSSELSPWIAQAAGLSLDWLVTGRGNEFDTAAGVVVTEAANAPLDLRVHPVVPNVNGAVAVPWAVVRSPAGDGGPELEGEPGSIAAYCASEWIVAKGLVAADLFAMKVKGDSMAPVIPDGARILVWRLKDVHSGKVHVLWRDGECYLKRVFKQFDGSLLIASENKTNDRDVVLRDDDLAQVEILGLVVSVSFDI